MASCKPCNCNIAEIVIFKNNFDRILLSFSCLLSDHVQTKELILVEEENEAIILENGKLQDQNLKLDFTIDELND